jgi:hypothetical protein
MIRDILDPSTEGLIIIGESQIRDVTPEGIVYADKDGAETFIDFEACYNNYLSEFLRPERIEHRVGLIPEHYSEEDAAKVIDDIRACREVCVTDGNIWQFYTEPPVLVVFGDNEKRIETLNTIGEYGWATFDAS